MGAERLPAAKVLLIQYGATMTLDQVRAAFMPGLTKKAIQNRISRGDLPAMHDEVFDTQQIGDWWESRCAVTEPRAA